jgi:RNA polymerase sigma-70 factor (ECF subfamily)
MRPLLAAQAPPGGSEGDEELLAQARGGDAGAFRAIFLRYAPSVRRLLGNLFRDAHAADEATQETFVRAHAGLGSLREAARLRGWLLGIARIVWLDAAERQRREAGTPAGLDDHPGGEPPGPESRLLEAEADAALRRALSRLGEARRTALLLRLDQGLGYADIAAALSWPLHKVKNEIHRARLAIRARLLDYLGGKR